MEGSWIPRLLGIIVIVGDILNLITVTIEKSGIPTNATQWIYTASGLATGIALIFTKQRNVTNSQHPGAPAVVPPALMAIPNPVATIKP